MVSRTIRSWTGLVSPEWKVTVTGARPPARGDASDRSVSHRPAGRAEDAADDRTLVTAALAGDRDAFDALVTRHQRSVYQLCYRFVGTHEDASDLAQEVFLRAFRGLKSFKGESTLSTWLYRIGVNVCLNRVSAKAPLLDLLDPERHVDARTISPEDAVLRAERAARVRAAIARLPGKQRATLVLRIYHELSHDEIAGILGSSVGAAKANLFHALHNLRKLLLGQP